MGSITSYTKGEVLELSKFIMWAIGAMFALLVSAISYIWHTRNRINSKADSELAKKLNLVSDKLQDVRDKQGQLDHDVELLRNDLGRAFDQIRAQKELSAQQIDSMNEKLDRLTSDLHVLTGEMAAASKNIDARFNDLIKLLTKS